MSKNVNPMTGTVVAAGKLRKHQTATPVVLVNADGSSAGTVKPQTKPADSVATTVAGVVTDLNALMAKLVTAGVLK